MIKKDLLCYKELFEQYISRRPHWGSYFSFPTLYLWHDFFDFDFRIIRDQLCIFASQEIGTFLYLPPLGESFDRDVVNACFDMMHERNQGSGLSRIENCECDMLDDPAGYVRSFKFADYCYRREDIEGLRGNTYKSKRADYNHFTKNHTWDYRSYDLGMAADCYALYRRWHEDRWNKCDDMMYRTMLDENDVVNRLVFERYQELDMIGRVVFVDGKIKAYTFGYPVSDDIFCVFLEITDMAIKGLPTFIFREFCADPQLQSYQIINVMDDCGAPNLRQTKESFRPFCMVPYYILNRPVTSKTRHPRKKKQTLVGKSSEAMNIPS